MPPSLHESEYPSIISCLFFTFLRISLYKSLSKSFSSIGLILDRSSIVSNKGETLTLLIHPFLSSSLTIPASLAIARTSSTWLASCVIDII